MENRPNSPFTPGSPVPVELFIGRKKQIEDVIRYIEQALSGKQENIFLEGDRGIGKSSLASLLRYWAITQKNMVGIHVFMGKVSTLEEMVQHIFNQLLKETSKEPWFKKIAQLFGEYIQQVDLFGISVAFSPPKERLEGLVRGFPDALKNLIEKIKDEKKGLFIVLDDINGLAEKEEFANWYKSFVDEVGTHYKNFPVFIMLIGLPEKRDRLASLQPSLMRIFRVIEIEKLTNDEVRKFLYKALDGIIETKPEAMNIMVTYSSGLPILMHEIGDATFWSDTDGVIDANDAIAGMMSAAENVGKKYLNPKVYRAIRSKNYRSILRKLGEIPLSRDFVKRDIEAKLDEKEKKVFHNFLRKLMDLEVIEHDLEKGRGSYRFVNEIYPVYIWMESFSFKKT